MTAALTVLAALGMMAFLFVVTLASQPPAMMHAGRITQAKTAYDGADRIFVWGELVLRLTPHELQVPDGLGYNLHEVVEVVAMNGTVWLVRTDGRSVPLGTTDSPDPLMDRGLDPLNLAIRNRRRADPVSKRRMLAALEDVRESDR